VLDETRLTTQWRFTTTERLNRFVLRYVGEHAPAPGRGRSAPRDP
jgi:hypothetical protein